ncbi:MAG: thymidylate kinase-like protein [Betaproteobacteria bacterium]|nr:thymidylate kinase-like protein [Betaproteobacteria bacterium]
MSDRAYLLQVLFEWFERDGIAYCVLGDARGLPEHIASDVDVAVSRETFAEIPRLMAQFCRAYDVRLVQMLRHEQTALYFVLVWAGEAGEAAALAIDFCSDYRRGGRLLLAADELLALREPARDDAGLEKGFYVPPPHVQFLYYLVKKVDKLDLGERHGELLSALWRSDPFRAHHGLARFWRQQGEIELIERAAEGRDWSAVRAELPRLQRALHHSAPLGAAGLAGELRRRLGRLAAPTGLVVAFLGPDGAGKSSVIARVLADLAPAFRRTRTMHLRPRLEALRPGRGAAHADPHARPARGAGASIAKLALFVLDYALGHALLVWPDKLRATLVAFDRYLHDMLVDPRRYRYGGPPALVRWAARCVPSPDLWVVLDAPAEVLQQRKSEVSRGESERQRAAYARMARGLRDAVVIDARGDPASVAAEAEGEILRCMEQRLEDRHAQLRVHDNPRAARVLLFFVRHRIPVLSRLCRIVFNSDIYCRMRFPILMPHPFGIIIHSHTVIGRRVTVMQQVTLGGKDLGENVAPVVEDDVYIGAGAKVLGRVRIGRGAMIGANAVVTRDVPPYCTVVGANRIVRGSVVDVVREHAQGPEEPRVNGLRSA